MLTRLAVVETNEEVVGARRSDAGASGGTYLPLAALNLLVASCSKLALQPWWKTTVARRSAHPNPGRGTGSPHVLGGDAHDPREQLAVIEHRPALRMIETGGLDISALALDMTNVATYIDSINDKASIAARYPGNRLDVTQFATMIDLLMHHYTAVATAASGDTADRAATLTTEMTVVVHGEPNSVANFAHRAASRLRFVGSVLEQEVFGKPVLITDREDCQSPKW